MKSITIRNVPDPIHRALRVRAAENGRSMEAELRVILARHFAPPVRPADPNSRRERDADGAPDGAGGDALVLSERAPERRGAGFGAGMFGRGRRG